MVDALIGVLGAVLGAIVSAVATVRLQKRKVSDREQFYSWRVVFDRPAFRGSFTYRSDPRPFVDAIRQTVRAVNTGTVFQPGVGEYVQHRGKGKGQLRNDEWRRSMDEVERRLHNILVVAEARVSEVPTTDDDAATIIDDDRERVIEVMNGIWAKLGISTLPNPKSEIYIYE